MPNYKSFPVSFGPMTTDPPTTREEVVNELKLSVAEVESNRKNNDKAGEEKALLDIFYLVKELLDIEKE